MQLHHMVMDLLQRDGGGGGGGGRGDGRRGKLALVTFQCSVKTSDHTNHVFQHIDNHTQKWKSGSEEDGW